MSAVTRLRDLQSRFPAIRSAKFNAYNWGTRYLGRPLQREFKLFERAAPAMLAIDIGGNWGQSIWALKRCARARRIVSFEPNGVLARRLERRFAGDAGVRIESCALGDDEGRFELFVPQYRGYVYDGLASLRREEAAGWLNPARLHGFDPALLAVHAQEVQVRCLDAFGFAPDIVKIDVQGAELAVVQGGLETFRAHQPAMLIETPSAELIDLLEALGLKAYIFDGRKFHRHDTSPANDVVFLSDSRRAALGW